MDEQLEFRIQTLESQVKNLKAELESIQKIVTKLNKSHVRSRVFKLIYFALVLVLGIVFYVYMAPYYQSLLEVYNFGVESKDSVQNLTDGLNNSQLQGVWDLIQ